MSEEATTRYIVFNERNQPVELHCGNRVVVVPPLGRVELEEAELAAPQLQILHKRRFITFRKVEDEAPGSDEDTSGEATETGATDNGEDAPETGSSGRKSKRKRSDG